jgi:acetyl-CoA carboxylase biotin carboxyl carrier protein
MSENIPQKKRTMKAKEIQELIDYISNSGLAEVKIKTEEFELSIKKYADQGPVRIVESVPAPVAPIAPAHIPAPVAVQPPVVTQSNLLEIKSPMIGTFYLTPNPDSPVFVSEGDTIKAGQTVCIIEAMKLFNEIDSEISGKIVKILVANATPVEYDQPLFLVDPAG